MKLQARSFATAAAQFGLSFAGDAPESAFMVLELVVGALAGAAGVVRYHAALTPAPGTCMPMTRP